MFRMFSYTEAGGHPVNEDAIRVRNHPGDERCLIGALADGQGGQAGGGRAAKVACETTVEAASGIPVEDLLSLAYWGTIFHRTDQAVLGDKDAGFTTLVAFAVKGNTLCGASSGDSALLAIDRLGRVMDLTRAQVKNPPIGCGDAIPIPFATELQPPWSVVAMSDGVWKYAGWDRVKEAMTKLRGQALIDSLQQSARMKGSGLFQDDFTVIVIQYSE